jgi:hypothetical protein
MSSTVDAMINNAWECLDANMAALNNGGNVDMSVFDKKSHEICSMLALLPPPEAKKHEGKLKELIVHLTEVTQKLEVRKNELAEKIDALNKRQTAYNAYGSAIFLALQTAGSED